MAFEDTTASYPRVDIRKDALGAWTLIHFTGGTIESVTVPASADTDGHYAVQLKEVPAEADTYGGNTAPIISGLTITTSTPASGEFLIDYNRGLVVFNSAQAGAAYDVDYYGTGTQLRSAEPNDLNTRISAVDSDITALETRATNLETRATDLETETTSLDTRVTTLEGGDTATVVTVTTTYTVLSTDDIVLCNATGGVFTVTLPLATSSSGLVYNIKKIDTSTNAITIDGNGTETIDGNLTIELILQNQSVTLCCNGTSWYII